MTNGGITNFIKSKLGVELVISDDFIEKFSEQGISTDGLFSIQQDEERPQETGFILSSVNGKKIREEKETGFRLSSVNGKSLEQLTASYQNVGINQSDLQVAYTTISRTKDEREQAFLYNQTQPNIDDFEGR